MNRLITATLLPLLLLFTGCDKEEDNFIPQITDNSIIISGVIRTPEGKPFANIPVSVDFKRQSIIGTHTKHKAKVTTDKSGLYKIFFEIGEDKDDEVYSNYFFSVDLAGVSSEKYIIPSDSKLDFYLNTTDREGKTLNCDFTIPMKKYVKVTVNNSGLPVENGKYAVKNTFSYGSDWDSLGYIWNSLGHINEMSEISIFQPIEIQQNGTSSIMLPCAVGVKNTILLVYKGNGQVNYGSGLPASETEEITVTGSTDREITFEYIKPDVI